MKHTLTLFAACCWRRSPAMPPNRSVLGNMGEAGQLTAVTVYRDIIRGGKHGRRAVDRHGETAGAVRAPPTVAGRGRSRMSFTPSIPRALVKWTWTGRKSKCLLSVISRQPHGSDRSGPARRLSRA